MKTNRDLSYEEAHELFRYCPDSGKLFWKVRKARRIKKGQEAGCVNRGGYRQVMVNGKFYLTHRLVFLIHEGYFPEGMIDHKYQDNLDNRIESIREANHQCNGRNTGNRTDNTSGVKGVCWVKREKKWKANIGVNQKNIHLGYYETLLEAACARLAAEQCLNWEGCNSSSPAYQYVKEHIPTIK